MDRVYAWMERVYPFVPVWAQNLGISLYGLHWRRERLGAGFDRAVAEFRERDRWSPSEMDAYVQERLRKTLLHAYDHVSYYHRRWTEAGLTRPELAKLRVSQLSRIPVTPKDHVRADPDQFVAQDIAKSAKLYRYQTSGSTGTPITAICTAEAHRRFIAAREVRSFGWAGASIRMPRSTLGGRRIVSSGEARRPFYRYNFVERQVYLSAYHLSPENVESYVEGLERHRPSVLTGYAQAHYLLSRMMLEQNIRLTYEPKAIVLSSEPLTGPMRRTIRSALGGRAYSEYGAVENCLLATECPAGGMHVSPDFGVIEILDPEGNPVPPEKEGRVVCTGLMNDAQPLIRYEIGDVAAWSASKCDCGRDHLPMLQDLVGRVEDVIIGPDGREMNRFHGVFIGLQHVLEAQVVQQRRDLIRVNVVATAEFNARDEEAIRRRISTERLPGMQVEVRRVHSIERTGAGKFRAVVSLARFMQGPLLHDTVLK